VAVVQVASLGRREAAADAMWLRTVQLMGSTAYETAGYPHLETWLGHIADLDPQFVTPYLLGAVLLTTDRARSEVVDEILARGEVALPHLFSLPMMRGFVAYFGALDPARAAGHYRRAAAFPDAPEYLGAFAKRLDHEVASCGNLQRNLADAHAHATQRERDMLEGEARTILENCQKTLLERGAAAFRLSRGHEPTVDEVVAEGLAEAPVAPRGQCWKLDHGRAALGPCPFQVVP
jgi:hypothetical protein